MASHGFQNTVENCENTILSVKGSIPPWLHGNLFRAGPGKFDIDTKGKDKQFSFQHWFDGLTQIHKFSILKGGVVEYRNKFTATEMEKVIEDGNHPGVTFGQDPCYSVFRKFFTFFNNSNVTNIGVVVDSAFPKTSTNNSLVIQRDANGLMELEEETLKPKEVFSYQNFDPSLDGLLSAAHSCIDSESGERFNYTLKFGSTCTYRLFGIKDGKVNIYATIKHAPAYIHSFSLTKNFIIFQIYPYWFKMNGLAIPYYKNILQALKWNADMKTSTYLVNRNTKEIKAFESEACFTFHHINAFEQDSKVFFDACEFEDASIVGKLTLQNLRSQDTFSCRNKIVRYCIDSDEISKTVLNEEGFTDLPRINPLYAKQPHRFVYGIHSKTNTLSDSLIKVDCSKSSSSLVWKEENCFPGEPIFVPSPTKESEDDGVILSVVLDSNLTQPSSFLLILDAKSMKEIARALVPQVICFGFHGDFKESQ